MAYSFLCSRIINNFLSHFFAKTHMGILRNILYIFSFLFLIISPCFSFEDFFSSYGSSSESIRPSKDLLDPRTYSLLKRTKLDFNILPEYTDYWSDYANNKSPDISYEYAGMHKIAYNQLVKITRRYVNQQSRKFWQESHLDLHELAAKQQHFYQELNSNQSWRGRSWRDYLQPDMGGQITITKTIGEEIRIFSIGPAFLTTEGKVSWNTWKVDIEDNSQIDRGLDIEGMRAVNKATLVNRYNLGIRSPDAKVSSDIYELKFNLRANIRIDNLGAENKSQVTVNFDLKLKNKGRAYLRLQSDLRIQPMTQQVEFRFQLLLFEF